MRSKGLIGVQKGFPVLWQSKFGLAVEFEHSSSTDEDRSRHWKPLVWSIMTAKPLGFCFSHRFVSRGRQSCSQIINLIHLRVTDNEAERQAEVSCLGGVFSTNMLSKKLSSPSFDLQIILRSHNHWFLLSFMENISRLALCTGLTKCLELFANAIWPLLSCQKR